ncbi:MAG: MucB/RseB C-terminal domain-containing protein [Cocleimonas sp.]|nr:MucB/RseB C-terminal domain-containing protein [Cocleimonas sp.]
MKKIITLICLASLPLPIFAADNAFNLLNKMTQSLSQMNYKGTLVHIKNNDVITLKVSHTVENGDEVERVERLNKNGSPYSRKVRDYSLSQLPKFDKKMQTVYSFDLGNIKKVAARPCQLVIARPKDRMRYLQKFCVDTKTSLLLDYTIIDKSHKPIEQFIFTSVEILSDESATKKASADTQQVIASNALSVSSDDNKEGVINVAWSLKKTPKGFKLRKGPAMEGETVAEHYILSDGLSSVSIFISKKVPNSKQTSTRSGALNVVTYYKEKFSITLVGAVPKSTLKDIFNNLQHKAN